MDWLSKHYDKALLLFVSIVAIAVSGIFVAKTFALGGAFGAADPKPKQDFDETGIGGTKNANDRLGARIEWKRRQLDSGIEVPLLASVPIVEREDNSIVNMLDPNGSPIREKDGLQIPNRWLFLNKLEYERSDVLNLDPDGDGFSNYEEYVGKTDPQNKTECPACYTQLRLKERQADPYVLRFTAKIPPQFQVAYIAPKRSDRKNWFKAVGDSFPDSKRRRFFNRFKIKDYREKKSADGKDVSELVIQDSLRLDNNPFVLVRGKETDRPIYSALFVYKHGGVDTEIGPIGVAETFKITEEDPPFTLKEIHEDHAIITFTPEGASAVTEERIPLDK